MIFTSFNNTRDDSGHSGHADMYGSGRVPSLYPDFQHVGTSSRDTFESITTGLSRLSRLVPTSSERGGA
jgi:hypothetical protein